MPDRTTALSQNDTDELLLRLEVGLRKLQLMGATRTVVCCVTIHALFADLPSSLREPLVSLIDIALEESVKKGGRHLMLCTNCSRAAQLFERSPFWKVACGQIVFPTANDQKIVHSMIYDVKNGQLDNRGIENHLTTVDRLIKNYEADSFIAGCTEFHIAAKKRTQSAGCIDPLQILAETIRAEARKEDHSPSQSEPEDATWIHAGRPS